MEQPNWVSEGSVRKYNRAVQQLQKEKKEVTEEAVKTLYTQFGGLVLGEPKTVIGVAPGDEEAADARAEEAEAPKRKARRTK